MMYRDGLAYQSNGIKKEKDMMDEIEIDCDSEEKKKETKE
jgi:hypothetical protein